jgi:hypothetical protein
MKAWMIALGLLPLSVGLFASANPPLEAPDNSFLPTVSVLDDGTQLRLDWENGASTTIAIQEWNINVLNALDCEAAALVDEQVFTARHIIATPAVDPLTGNVAVPVLLNECLETQQMAVFIVDAHPSEGYALYRAQLPGERTLPHEFSSYPFSSIQKVQYTDSALHVWHSSASGAEAMVTFSPSISPANQFESCDITQTNEGADRLCP